MKDINAAYLLVENGNILKINEENKKQFAKKIAEFKMFREIADEILAFNKGFYSIIPFKYIQSTNYLTLKLLIAGIPEINSKIKYLN